MIRFSDQVFFPSFTAQTCHNISVISGPVGVNLTSVVRWCDMEDPQSFEIIYSKIPSNDPSFWINTATLP